MTETGEFGAWVNAQMLARRLSSGNMAERTGLSKQAVWRIARGDTAPSLATMLKIVAALGHEVHVIPSGRWK